MLLLLLKLHRIIQASCCQASTANGDELEKRSEAKEKHLILCGGSDSRKILLAACQPPWLPMVSWGRSWPPLPFRAWMNSAKSSVCSRSSILWTTAALALRPLCHCCRTALSVFAHVVSCLRMMYANASGAWSLNLHSMHPSNVG